MPFVPIQYRSLCLSAFNSDKDGCVSFALGSIGLDCFVIVSITSNMLKAFVPMEIRDSLPLVD